MPKSSLVSAIEARWYGKAGALRLLAPLEFVFQKIANKRKRKLQATAKPFAVPVVVVGNISVGGTGKTPTLVALVKYLQSRGLRPGVVSRGYGRKSNELALAHYDPSPEKIGDEPALIYRATKCDIAVSAKRVEAVEALIQHCQCDLVLCDDGLQHFQMHRDAEIAVVDGVRGFGNGHLLPVGPLREKPERLQSCDWVLINGGDRSGLLQLKGDSTFPIEIQATGVTHIASGDHFGLEKLQTFKKVVAMAGIGDPAKFFSTLTQLGVDFESRAFADHHPYSKSDLEIEDCATLLMTEKDAVKCEHLVGDNAYYLTISMVIPESMLESLYRFIMTKKSSRSV